MCFSIGGLKALNEWNLLRIEYVMREREREIGVMSQDIPIPTTGLSCYLWLNVSPSSLITACPEIALRTPTRLSTDTSVAFLSDNKN